MNKPKCAIPGCKKDALVYALGRFICGDCYVKYIYSKQDELWKEIESDSKINTK